MVDVSQACGGRTGSGRSPSRREEGDLVPGVTAVAPAAAARRQACFPPAAMGASSPWAFSYMGRE